MKKRILQGIGAGALWQCVNMFTQLAGLPIFLAVWGVEKYGDWLVLYSLAACLSLSDFGFTSVATNEMTMRVGRGDRDGALTVYQSMWSFLCAINVFTMALALAALWLSPAARGLPLSLTSPSTATSVLSVLAIYVVIGQQIAVIQAGFRCDGNFATDRMFGTCGKLAEFVGQVVIAIVSGSMLAIALTSLIIRCALLLLFTIALKKRSPWLRHGYSRADRETIQQLARPAFTFMGIPLGHAMSNQGMIQVVATFLGPTAVVIFSAHRTLANASQQVVSTINMVVRPEYSAAFGDDNLALASRIHQRACQSALWLSLCMCVMLALGGPWIIHYWTQGNLEIDYPLFSLLLLLTMTKSVWITCAFVPLAINRHKRLATIFVLGSGTALLLAAILASHLGLIGVVAGLAFTDVLMVCVTLKMSLNLVNGTLFGFCEAVIRPPFFFDSKLLRPTNRCQTATTEGTHVHFNMLNDQKDIQR